MTFTAPADEAVRVYRPVGSGQATFYTLSSLLYTLATIKLLPTGLVYIPFLFGEVCVLSRELSRLCLLAREGVLLFLTTPPSRVGGLLSVSETERLGVLGALLSFPELKPLEEAFLTLLILRMVLHVCVWCVCGGGCSVCVCMCVMCDRG